MVRAETAAVVAGGHVAGARLRGSLQAAAHRLPHRLQRQPVDDDLEHGLDVGWDLYVAAGTFLFALAMRRAPGFGPVFAWSGMALAAGLLALNVATFPVPPGDAGLVDLGPAVALWYVAVSIQLARLLRRGGAAARA